MLEITEKQLIDMVLDTARYAEDQLVRSKNIRIFASRPFKDSDHCSWAFCIGDGVAFGSIERHWGGLKMICSVLGGSARSSFFTRDGIRTSNKELRENGLASQ